MTNQINIIDVEYEFDVLSEMWDKKPHADRHAKAGYICTPNSVMAKIYETPYNAKEHILFYKTFFGNYIEDKNLQLEQKDRALNVMQHEYRVGDLIAFST